jgi:hypothetical protein
VQFVTKVSLHFWNLRKKTDFLIPNMTLFEKKHFLLYLADFWPFGNTKAHFSAWKVNLKFVKNNIWCSFHFLITILPRFLDIEKKVKYWRWLFCMRCQWHRLNRACGINDTASCMRYQWYRMHFKKIENLLEFEFIFRKALAS